MSNNKDAPKRRIAFRSDTVSANVTKRAGEERLRKVEQLRQAWEEAEERAREATAEAKTAFDAYNRARDTGSALRAKRTALSALVE